MLVSELHESYAPQARRTLDESAMRTLAWDGARFAALAAGAACAVLGHPEWVESSRLDPALQHSPWAVTRYLAVLADRQHAVRREPDLNAKAALRWAQELIVAHHRSAPGATRPLGVQWDFVLARLVELVADFTGPGVDLFVVTWARLIDAGLTIPDAERTAVATLI